MLSNSLICGIDLSLTETGICIIDMSGKIVYCESINTYPLVDGPRINYIYERLTSLFNSFLDISIIGFERQVRQQRYNFNAKYILDIAEAFGVLKLVIHQLSISRDISVYQYTAQDLKVYLAGNGKATKEDMIASISKRSLSKIESYVIPSAVDDVVDAYAVAKRTLDLLKEPQDIHEKYIYTSNHNKEVVT